MTSPMTEAGYRERGDAHELAEKIAALESTLAVGRERTARLERIQARDKRTIARLENTERRSALAPWLILTAVAILLITAVQVNAAREASLRRRIEDLEWTVRSQDGALRTNRWEWETQASAWTSWARRRDEEREWESAWREARTNALDDLLYKAGCHGQPVLMRESDRRNLRRFCRSRRAVEARPSMR